MLVTVPLHFSSSQALPENLRALVPIAATSATGPVDKLFYPPWASLLPLPRQQSPHLSMSLHPHQPTQYFPLPAPPAPGICQPALYNLSLLSISIIYLLLVHFKSNVWRGIERIMGNLTFF